MVWHACDTSTPLGTEGIVEFWLGSNSNSRIRRENKRDGRGEREGKRGEMGVMQGRRGTITMRGQVQAKNTACVWNQTIPTREKQKRKEKKRKDIKITDKKPNKRVKTKRGKENTLWCTDRETGIVCSTRTRPLKLFVMPDNTQNRWKKRKRGMHQLWLNKQKLKKREQIKVDKRKKKKQTIHNQRKYSCKEFEKQWYQ